MPKEKIAGSQHSYGMGLPAMDAYLVQKIWMNAFRRTAYRHPSMDSPPA